MSLKFTPCMLYGLIYYKEFVGNEVVLVYIFHLVFLVLSITVIPPKFHNRIHFNTALIRSISGQSLGIF